MRAQEGFNKDSLIQKVSQYRETIRDKGLTPEYYTFGDSVKKINSFKSWNFEEQTTDFSKVIDFMNEGRDRNVSGALILSDGVVTKGQLPQTIMESSQYNIYTKGIGDTSRTFDAEIINFEVPRSTHQGDTVKINTEVAPLSKEKRVKLVLKENEEVINEKSISGVKEYQRQKSTFTYIPQNTGDQKLQLELKAPDDNNQINNKRIKTVQVQQSANNYIILSDEFNFDGKIINYIYSQKERVKIHNMVMQEGNWIGIEKPQKVFNKEWKLLIMNGFPAKNSTIKPERFSELKSKIRESRIPILLIINRNTNIKRLEELIGSKIIDQVEYFKDNKSRTVISGNDTEGYLGNYLASIGPTSSWNRLPPIDYPFKKIKMNSGFSTLINTTDKSVQPVLGLRLSESKNSSLAIMAGAGFWRWHFMTLNSQLNNTYESSLLGISEILTDTTMSTIDIYTDRKKYRKDEFIELKGEVRDLNQKSIENAVVQASVFQDDQKIKEIYIAQTGDKYSTNFSLNQEGHYRIELKRTQNDKVIDKVVRKIEVIDRPVEFQKVRLNQKNLKSIAQVSGAKYLNSKDMEQLEFDAEQHYVKEQKEIKLWRWEYVFYLLVLLFSVEWGYRKLKGFL